MNKQNVVSILEERFRKTIRKDSNVHNAYLYVHSKSLGIDLNMAEGQTESFPAHPEQPYYIASVGKLFTAVLIGQLVEQGKLSYEDTLGSILDDDLLRGLHVYKGHDYSEEIKVKQLLNHTAGVNDYYSDKPKNRKAMVDIMLDEPDRIWEPVEILEWSKQHLTSHFAPGNGMHYSDTGYLLLGLIVEKISGKSFHEALHTCIFDPLNMRHSYLLHYSQPAERSTYPVAHVYAGEKKVRVDDYRSMSVDWAGGGIVSTPQDLLTFIKAITNYSILKKETFLRMHDSVKFFPGIDYGYGLMRLKSIPFLMPKIFDGAWGNAGIIGSFLFYHPHLDTYFIGNYNRFYYNRKGIRLMLKMIHALGKQNEWLAQQTK